MSTTTNLALNEPAYNSTSPTWDQPLNYNSTILDQMFGNTTGVSVNTGASTYTNIAAPSATGAGSTSQCMRFNLTGALSANQTVLLPQGIAGMWVVTNNTTNSFTVTVGSNNGSNASAGTTVSVPQGYNTLIYCDGTNVKKADDGGVTGTPTFSGITVTGTATIGTAAITTETVTTSTVTTQTVSGTSQIASLGVGTAASGTTGEIRATNNITAYYSDDRLKTRLGEINNALDKVKSLSGFYYEANETAQALGYKVYKEVGVSAQSVQAVMPEVVAPAPIDEQYLTVRYERLVPLLIEAIKELSAKVEKLEGEKECRL
jgi:hypothetical protein